MRLQVVYLPADRYLIVLDEVGEDEEQWLSQTTDLATRLGAVHVIAVTSHVEVVQ